MRRPRSRLDAPAPLVAVGCYAMQVFLATAGTMLAGTLLIAGALPEANMPHSLQDPAELAVMGIVGLAAGFVTSSILQRRSGTWVWPLPALWFSFGFLESLLWEIPPHTFHSALAELGLLGANACPGDCITMVLLVYPLPGAACYSLGAWLALRRRR